MKDVEFNNVKSPGDRDKVLSNPQNKNIE